MLNRLQWPGPTMLVTAPAVANPPGSPRFDARFVDPVDGLGPMRGLLTALEHAATPAVISLAVDMPLIEQKHLCWFHEMLLANPEASGLMCKTNSQIEPFPAAYRTSTRDIVRSNLAIGQLSLHRLCGDSRFLSLDCPAEWDTQAWTNLNDLAQFTEFESCETR